MHNKERRGTIVASAVHRVGVDGVSRYDATARIPGDEELRFFFEISGDIVPPRVQRDDFLVLALLFYAMRRHCDLYIDGPVSRELLANLEEFQRAWAMWVPERYRIIDVSAREEVDEISKTNERIAVAAFSGGVDATFAIARHAGESQARDRCRIVTAVLIHGFDIELQHDASFGIARENARLMSGAMGVPLTTVRTDWRALTSHYWEHEYCPGLTACLALFGEVANVALMASGEDYNHIVVPWSSNPVTNPLLSSATFRNFTEGNGFTRTDKVREIARFPEVAERLRVCWQGPQTGQNCGTCEKCTRTKLNFLANDLPIPTSLGAPPSPMEIARIKANNSVQMSFLEEIFTYAQRSRMPKPMKNALQVAIIKNRIVNRVPLTRHLLRAVGTVSNLARRSRASVGTAPSRSAV